MERIETLWECLHKRIEFDTSDSTYSPPLKRKRLRRLVEFKSAKDLEDLKSVATEVVELKDYAEWFMSKSKGYDDILNPLNYYKWISTLGTEAKANVIVHPYNYFTWYDFFVVQGRTEVPYEYEPYYEMDHTKRRKDKYAKLNKTYAEVALAHFNKTRNCIEEYEYTRHSVTTECLECVHLNFFARLKVSKSRPEPGPLKLFFAEVFDRHDKVTQCCIVDYNESEVFDRHDKVTQCCIVDYNESGNMVVHPDDFDVEFAGLVVRHPEDVECVKCKEYDMCCSGCM